MKHHAPVSQGGRWVLQGVGVPPFTATHVNQEGLFHAAPARERLVTVSSKRLISWSCRKVFAYCPWPFLMSWWWHVCISDPGVCHARLTDPEGAEPTFPLGPEHAMDTETVVARANELEEEKHPPRTSGKQSFLPRQTKAPEKTHWIHHEGVSCISNCVCHPVLSEWQPSAGRHEG